MNAEQLKSSILQQAIAGKLVPQCASEGGVKQLGNVSEDVPYDLPSNWKWIKADFLLEFVRGITFPASAKNRDCLPGMIRCLTTGSVQKEHNSSSDVFVSSSYVKKERQYLKKNDIVISSANSRELVGKSILWSETEKNVAFGGFLTVARVKEESVDATYAFYVFQALFSLRYFENLSTQTTNIANLSNTLLSNVLFPIPPICEQARIVAKIEELLPLVEAYGKSYNRLQELNAELPGKLKASILQEAIQGKLVPQLDSEEAVEQIGDAPEEVPFGIPEKWKWCCFGSIGKFSSPRRVHKAEWRSEGIPFLRARELANLADTGKLVNDLFIERDLFLARKAKGEVPQAGDLVFTAVGTLGKCYVVREGDVFFCKDTNTLRFAEHQQYPAYLQLIFSTPYFQELMKKTAVGSTVKNLTIGVMKEYLVPIPPKEEQKRIVARIAELMKQVDALSTR